MKFHATDLEFWSQNGVETVFFGNEEKELVLVMSSALGSSEHYLEWNDQSNSCYNGVEEIELSGWKLRVLLLAEAAKQIGESEIAVDFECDEETYKQIAECLKHIFDDQLKIGAYPADFKKKEAPKKDYSKIRYLGLDGKKLKKLPDYVREMTAVETAKLGNNPKLDLEDAFEVLSGMPFLKELAISAEEFIPENIGKLTSLESLTITDLTKPCFLPESMANLKKLKYLLILSDSDVILPESFSALTELESLNIRANCWQPPTELYRLSKLKTLDLGRCLIATFPEEMTGMQTVENIYLTSVDGRDFPQMLSVVARMPNVKNLEIDANPVPKEIGLCKNIEELHIWSGTGKNTPLLLPGELFELSQLQTLIVTMSSFDKIPDEIGRLKSLKTLAIKECDFETLPDSIGELSNLEFLTLSENTSFKTLPESFGKLTQLKGLNLAYNEQLTRLPDSAKNLIRLESVNLPEREKVENVPEAWKDIFN